MHHLSDLGAQRAGAVGKLAGLHPHEQVKVLLDGAIAVRAVGAGLVGRAAVLIGILGREVADVGLTLLDQGDGVLENLVEIVAGEKRFERDRLFPGREMRGNLEVGLAVDGNGHRSLPVGLEAEAVVGPIADQPVDVLHDRLDVLDILLGRVGVVHAQVALAAVFAGDAEIQADRLGVADVQVAVGLRRETRDDLRVAFLRNMLGDDIADEIARCRRRCGGSRVGHNEPSSVRTAPTRGNAFSATAHRRRKSSDRLISPRRAFRATHARTPR